MKVTKTTKTTTDVTNLVAGKFRENSRLASMYNLLKDGKARTAAEIAKVTKTKKVANVSGWKYTDLQRWGRESGTFTMVKLDDGKIQMLRGKKAARTSKPAVKKAA